MKIEFEESSHTYMCDGKKFPSVTQILREVLDPNAEFTRTDAMARGSAVHSACEMFDQNDLDESNLDPRLVPYLEGWKKFRADSGFVPDGIELRVASAVYQYAGTLDRRGKIAGRPTVLDIKSGGDSPNVGLQTAAYVVALIDGEEKATKPDRAVVYLPGEGNYRLVRLARRDDYSDWQAVLRVYNYKVRK